MNKFNKVKKIFRPIKHLFLDPFAVQAFSQEGEDLILRRIYENQKNGFFVDIGAHHPKRFSNTYLLYKAGWRGINIDAMPGSMAQFMKYRPADINIEAAISIHAEELPFYIFNVPAINTFDEMLALRRQTGNIKIVNKVRIRTKRLDEILDQYLPKGTAIDFLTIDVEGKDLEVLMSNNWNKYRSTYILVESMNDDRQESLLSDPVYQYVTSLGYEFFAKTVNTLFFKDQKQH